MRLKVKFFQILSIGYLLFSPMAIATDKQFSLNRADKVIDQILTSGFKIARAPFEISVQGLDAGLGTKEKFYREYSRDSKKFGVVFKAAFNLKF